MSLNVKRAVLNAGGWLPGIAGITDQMAGGMVPVAGRPLVQRVLEQLVAREIVLLDIIVAHRPEQVEGLLGNGERWGCSIRYHVATSAETAAETYTRIDLPPDEWVLLADVQYVWADGGSFLLEEEREVLVERDGVDGKADTGWGLIHGETLSAGRMGQLPRCVSSGEGWAVDSYQGYLELTKQVLDGALADAAIEGHDGGERIWFSRNVMLHPSVQVTPPVQIGPDCQIGRGVTLGPYVVLGEGSVLDSGCSVEDAVVLPGSYIGEGLELSGVMIDRNRLINCRLGGVITVTDRFILAAMQEKNVAVMWSHWLNRLAGVLIAVLFSPLFFVQWMRRKGHQRISRSVVRLPTVNVPECWRTYELVEWIRDELQPGDAEDRYWDHLLFSVLPGLRAVISGKLNLVGVKPRTVAEIQALSDDWRDLYLKASAGLISEAHLLHGAHPSDDELYAAESYYAVRRSGRYAFRLAVRYAAKVIRGCRIAGTSSNPSGRA